jgi:hypothetical protein
VLERRWLLSILHQQDGALQAMFGRLFLVGSGVTVSQEHQLNVLLFETGFKTA